MTPEQLQLLHNQHEREEAARLAGIEAWLKSGEGRDHRSGAFKNGDYAPGWSPFAVEVRPTERRGRHLRLDAAAGATPRRVRWLWDERLALGTLALVGGREGTGKTLMTNDLAAAITRGTLPGEHFGHARGVIVVTTEDSWDMTIVPRLMAAGADLTRVYRADIETSEGFLTGLSLPKDLVALEHLVREYDVALIVLDPLMSRLDPNLDTHKDGDVRLALEPLVSLAERTRTTLIGLIHVNKSGSTDPLTALMASRAFPAVARAGLFVMKDPDEPETRLVGQEKNNLGRTDLPTLRFIVEAVEVGRDPEDGQPIIAPRLVWQETTTRTISDALAAMVAGPRVKSKKAEAQSWLVAYLQACEDGREEAGIVQLAASRAGHGTDPLRRAREGADVAIVKEGFPAKVYWQLPVRLLAPVEE
jgi:hypothetical protein